MNEVVIAEEVSCLHKHEKEATKVGTAQEHEATYLVEIQCQRDIESYTCTISAYHAIVMNNFLSTSHENKQKK